MTLLLAVGAAAQMAMPPGMAMGGGRDPFIAALLAHSGSGTSEEPESVAVPMLMRAAAGWRLMLHGEGFVNLQQQSGARGFDKLFSTNWAMGMAQRDWGPGQLTLRGMLSLEPATVTERAYPELFQTGETAFGRAIVDGQHPHNFFMELAAAYDLKLGGHGLLSVYAAPVGDPAIGPMAYPHRASASEDPLAALGHHLEDSTHIAASVVTVGAAWRRVRIEGSSFHGREPDERRWRLETGRPDSYAWRVTANPAADWSGQFSWAHIHSPEALNPSEDQIRMTASLMWNRRLAGGAWSNTLLWGRTRAVGGGHVFNGYLAESNLGWARNHLWTRIENVDKSDELLLGVDRFLARVQAYSFGYDRQVAETGCGAAAVGAQWTLYQAPTPVVQAYGAHPQGVVVFLRLRLGSK
ncbi:MAG: hypothetical protein ACRD1E_03490 [Terriglobales bacterium]